MSPHLVIFPAFLNIGAFYKWGTLEGGGGGRNQQQRKQKKSTLSLPGDK